MKNTVNKYFEVKVKMQKTQEDGTQKKVSEQYGVLSVLSQYAIILCFWG